MTCNVCGNPVKAPIADVSVEPVLGKTVVDLICDECYEIRLLTRNSFILPMNASPQAWLH